ncbi:MAG: lysophospholipid acyltransferase family protein [Acidobacteria bacterium]|nr:lysophospholipid acyltransferase family protein [Acidobacteriota bacterium]
MQAKMATAPPWKVRLYQWFFGLWFPVFLLLSKCPKVILPVASFFMRVFFWIRPQYLEAIASNYQTIFPDKSPADCKALALQMVDNHSRYWVEFFKFGKLTGDPTRLLENPEALDQVLTYTQAGQGAILVTAHMGNWELGGNFFGRLVRPLTVIYVRDRFNIVERFRSRFRRYSNIKECPVDRSLFSTLPALRALEQGEFLALQGDRDFNERGVLATFFGKTCTFPEGPYHLALLARVPVIPCFTLYGKDGRYRIHLYPPIHPPANGKREDRVQEMLNQYLRVLEDVVRQYPDQWYTFYPFFEIKPDHPAISNAEGA